MDACAKSTMNCSGGQSQICDPSYSSFEINASSIAVVYEESSDCWHSFDERRKFQRNASEPCAEALIGESDRLSYIGGNVDVSVESSPLVEI